MTAALHRENHTTPEASNTRDQHEAGWIGGAERRSSGRELRQRGGSKLDSDESHGHEFMVIPLDDLQLAYSGLRFHLVYKQLNVHFL